MSFSSLGISEVLIRAIKSNGFTEPYPIQKEAIPQILKKRDVLGIAQTGSGKTASYVLPLLQNLEGKTSSKNRHINVLVLVPTRELAIQVQEVFHLFGSSMESPIRSMAVYGGVSVNPQMKNLRGVHVLVATPGRLLELIDSNAVHFEDLDALVLDEADKMLNLGFQDEVDRILKLLPKKRQNLLFSATLNDDVSSITRVLLHEPVVIKIEAE